MDDFDNQLEQLGERKKTAIKPAYQLTPFKLNKKYKQPCDLRGYPFCRKSLVIHYHEFTSAVAKPGTVSVRCTICKSYTASVDVKKWEQDRKKSL